MDQTDYYHLLAFYRASGLSESESHAKAEDLCQPHNLLQEVHDETPEAHTTG